MTGRTGFGDYRARDLRELWGYLLVGEPGQDLVPFPFGVGGQLVEVACCVLANPRGLGACVLGPRVGGRGALIGLRGRREGLVASVVRGAHEHLSCSDSLRRLGLGLLDSFPGLSWCVRDPGVSVAYRGGSLGPGLLDSGGLVCLGRADRAVRVFPGDGTGRRNRRHGQRVMMHWHNRPHVSGARCGPP